MVVLMMADSQVPMFVIHKPSNLITEEAQMEEAKQKDLADARAAKKITFRIRLTTGGPDLQVTCKDTTTMGQIKRKIERMKKIAVSRLTVVYQGRSCPDDFSLRVLEIAPDTVVQIMVKSAPRTDPPAVAQLPPETNPPVSPSILPADTSASPSGGRTGQLSPEVAPEAPSPPSSDELPTPNPIESPGIPQTTAPPVLGASSVASDNNDPTLDPSGIPTAIPATTPLP